MKRTAPRTAITFGAVIAAVSLVLAGCSSSGGTGSSGSGTTGPVTQAEITKAMNTPTTITFWSWLPGVHNEISLFEKKYPKIKVNYQNAGQGTPEYTKLRTVIKAGSGQPDVAQVEYQYISSFASALANLKQYGAANIQAEFTPSVWKQVSLNGQVLGVPQDIGPMGNLYRSDIYKKGRHQAADDLGRLHDRGEGAQNEDRRLHQRPARKRLGPVRLVALAGRI